MCAARVSLLHTSSGRVSAFVAAQQLPWHYLTVEQRPATTKQALAEHDTAFGCQTASHESVRPGQEVTLRWLPQYACDSTTAGEMLLKKIYPARIPQQTQQPLLVQLGRVNERPAEQRYHTPSKQQPGSCWLSTTVKPHFQGLIMSCSSFKKPQLSSSFRA